MINLQELTTMENTMTSEQTPAGFAPVVTEEMVNALGLELQGYRSGIFEDPISSEDAEAALTAALPHAKTEAEVEEAFLERLIAEAEKQRADAPAYARGYDSQRWQEIVGWLRAQKGKSDE
jgi:hypothetical protein